MKNPIVKFEMQDGKPVRRRFFQDIFMYRYKYKNVLKGNWK